jgi:peptidoglycan/LPS O-acetylase OafA/YrhL
LDLLRLVAAAFVLYSHQYALLGLPEPSFFGWNSFGGAGVTVFFFLSGMLVSSSWMRDADIGRFFQRRCLRIFPALWVTVLLTISILGPLMTTLPWLAYFNAAETWRYLTTAILLPRNVLPGVFETNPYPFAINGSLWTLPVEFLCYVTVAVVGIPRPARDGGGLVVALLIAVLLAAYAPLLAGARFTPHFEMIAIFWWGALYGYCTARPWKVLQGRFLLLGLIALAGLGFALLGTRGAERTALVLFAMAAVALAERTGLGVWLTDRLGDLSYGVYIYAFPVQQIVVHWNGSATLSFTELFVLSALLTFALAYASWHLIERPALRLKPRVRVTV